MTARGGDFDGAFDGLLAVNFLEVEFVGGWSFPEGGGGGGEGLDGEFAAQVLPGLAERADGDDVEAADEGGFWGVCLGDEEAETAILFGAEGDGEGAFDGADGAVEGEFADDAAVVHVNFSRLASGGDGEGDGEIERWAFFFEIGGCEVDGFDAVGHVDGGGLEGGDDALAGFADSGVGETDDDDEWFF